MTTAIFSNGTTDTYKGKRAVKAAWLVVTPSGRQMSGHSIDVQTAEKTARNNAAQMVRKGGASLWDHKRISPAYIGMREKEARKAGFSSYAAWLAAEKAETAAELAKCKIEVVVL